MRDLISRGIGLQGVTTKYNVKSYGAKGDGTVDDTAAIQRCIDEVPSHSTILFPDGIYLVSGLYIFQKPNLTIRGENATLKLKDYSTKDILLIEESPWLSLFGVHMDGNKDHQTVDSNGLVLKASYFAWILESRILNCKRDGVNILGYYDDVDTQLFRGNDEIHISHCFIQSNGRHGVYIDSVADFSIDDNNIEFNGDVGVSVTQTTGIGSGNSTIVNNQIISNDGHGIEIVNDSSRILINLNHIRNNGKMGIRYIGGKQFNISHNNIHMNGRLFPYSAGIIVGYTHDALITHNFISCTDFTATQGYAIEIVGVTDILVTGNIAKDNLQTGISVSDSTLVKVYNNIGIADQ